MLSRQLVRGQGPARSAGRALGGIEKAAPANGAAEDGRR